MNLDTAATAAGSVLYWSLRFPLDLPLKTFVILVVVQELSVSRTAELHHTMQMFTGELPPASCTQYLRRI